MDTYKANRLRKIRDEIDRLIDEEYNNPVPDKYLPYPWQPFYPDYWRIYPLPTEPYKIYCGDSTGGPTFIKS